MDPNEVPLISEPQIGKALDKPRAPQCFAAHKEQGPEFRFGFFGG